MTNLHPAKRVLRTAIQVIVSLASVIPLVVADLPASVIGGQIVAVSLAVTRIMAIKQVNEFLTRWGLGAEPREKTG